MSNIFLEILFVFLIVIEINIMIVFAKKDKFQDFWQIIVQWLVLWGTLEVWRRFV